METTADSGSTSPAWFVGAMYSGTDDQLPRFLKDGIWENGYDDKLLDMVRSMRPGDRIAVKSSYTRKYGLPFDNRGQSVSVIAIKAIGSITENLNDGKRVRVNWTKLEPPREWYFYTNRGTVWRVLPGEWKTDGLIAFAFDAKNQDIERFQNSPYWRERFGSAAPDKRRFAWTTFYESVATKLLDYRNNRSGLIKAIRDISQRVDGLGHLTEDQYADGSKDFVRDICPFTVMGLFNRGITDANRKIIAKELASALGVTEAVPDTFEGIPVLNNLGSWFFGWAKDRPPDQIDSLWQVFATGIQYAESDDEKPRDAFALTFDDASGRFAVGWKLTIGLYWIRPWSFLSLDGNSRAYITKKLSISIGKHGSKKRCDAADYLGLMDVLENRFQESSYSVHSYPELSLEAWTYKDPSELVSPESGDEPDNLDAGNGEISDQAEGIVNPPAPIVPYSAEHILDDGCFLARETINLFLDRLRDKKNLIIQGPPGTGKSWLAKRLAFALIGQKDESKVRRVQFHPNMSYEDFVRGWRPSGDGRLSLKDGVFMEVINAASRDSKSRFVMVIEEINRGNPAQIFGEMLTLLEDGKRNPDEAIELCYPDEHGRYRRVHIPENVFVIGTMNVADRSLALVDMALRRRFAFVSLEPVFGSVWRKWVVEVCNIDSALATDIENRIIELNTRIANFPGLGIQFCIGHSFVTPSRPLETGDTRKWFSHVVDTEIGPILDEYWFDKPAETVQARNQLLQGW
jgi:5-methylcytosine-specific restriction protein B